MIDVILWIIAIGFTVIAVHDFVIPFIKRKLMWFSVIRKMKKIIKSNPKSESLDNILKEMKECNKEEKL